MMKQYYKLKANCKDWFASTSPREQKEVLEQHITTMLRERDSNGRRVLICKLAFAAHTDLSSFSFGDDLKEVVDFVDTSPVLLAACKDRVFERSDFGDVACFWGRSHSTYLCRGVDSGPAPHYPLSQTPPRLTTVKSVRKNNQIKAKTITNADPGKVTPYQWAHTDDLWLETALDEEETQKNGISIIVDAGNIPWKFLKFANPFNATFIHFHYQDRASLHKFINPEILPEEYGGKVPKIEYEEQEKYLHEKEDVLLADNLFPGLVLPGETPESLLAASEDYFTGAQMVPSSGAHKNIVEEVSMAQQVKKERHLSAEWVQRASEELNEKPEKVQDDINTLRSMIVAETNLHVPADDAFLLRFLRARKFNCTKAFHMLQRYYVMKLRCPELFKIPRPSEKKYILEMQAQNMLEDRDGFGRRVYIFRVEKCDAANVSIEDVFRTNVLALEQVVDEPETQIAGLTVIVDMNGFGIQHAKFLSPYYARRTVEVIQETFPLRFKGFHVINEPFYFDAVFAVLKPFLKEKIRKRIYFHGRELSSLHAFISPDILPEEYGGKRPCFDNKTWRMALLANEDKLIELETYGYKVDEESS
uniref:CRAL-TRIO domain-containing protein n=1 Tax=Timema douglasi TaxID=61478 RepID=A0A7R8Z483_TIMDO|nr:unnamed protein product [Timema douglasi]